MLLTHAHLDHCGLIPHVVKEGYGGPIYATHGTVELTALVLLDSGKLQQELAKRSMRWERRHPDQAEAEDEDQLKAYHAAVALAEAGEALVGSPAIGQTGSMATAEHVPTAVEPADPDDSAEQPDLDAPLYDEADARTAMLQFKPVAYDHELEVAPGIHAHWLDAGHILGSAIIVLRIEGSAGEPELTVVFSGDLGRPGAPILRDYTTLTSADYVLVETTYGGREHQPEQEALEGAVRDGAPGRRGERRAPGAVIRDRPYAGADLRARPADRRRRDPDAAALSRLAHGVEGDGYLSAARRVLRRGGGAARAVGPDAAGLPEAGDHQQRPSVGGRSPMRHGRT